MENQLKQRLTLIDMYLHYWGRVQRKDLARHFDIGSVTASRALKAYIDRHPTNIEFSVNKRAYVISQAFECAYKTEPETALMMLAYGTEFRLLDSTLYGPPRTMAFTAPLTQKWVSAVTRAMVSKSGVGICYVSLSGEKTRTVYPHAIFQGGAAWYFRAYDALKSEFRTFRFSRIVGLSETTKPISEPNRENDNDWNTQVTLTLAPHQNNPSRETSTTDLGLKGRPVSNAMVNRVIAGFILTDLRVDCSKSASLDPKEFPLQLQNRSELLGVNSMTLAPGFIK